MVAVLDSEERAVPGQTMIERVARALCRVDGHPEDAKMDGKPLWASYEAEARAAIAEMRHPTPAMVTAGRPAFEKEPLPLMPLGGQIQGAWMAMIDEALDR